MYFLMERIICYAENTKRKRKSGDCVITFIKLRENVMSKSSCMINEIMKYA